MPILPIPGETQEEYIVRFLSADKKAKKEDAEKAWKEISSKHTGNSEGPCCKGKTLEHVAFSVNFASYSVQVKKFEGRDHIIVPVVMLTEGVHHGSGGPVFYPAEEIAKFPAAWNGVPTPIYHPEDNGFPISCNSPDVLEKQNVGRVFGAQAVEGGKKLKAELWLDIVKLQELDPALLAKINSKETIEVSTGLFMEVDETPGEWNGEKYEGTAKNFRPDHLALLPVGLGACSVADGCGIRANQAAIPNYQALYERLVTHANPSFNEVMRMIRQQVLSPMEVFNPTGGKTSVYMYLREVFSDYFVYEKESGPITQFFKQKYKLSSDKSKIELDGIAIEVIESTTYKEVKNNKRTTKGGSTVNREEMIAYLTANGFSPNAKDWEPLSDEMLAGMVESTKEKIAANAAKKEAEKKLEDHIAANTKQKTPTPEEFIAQAPADIQMMLNRALERDRKSKAFHVETLMKNQKVFGKEELEAKSLEELEKLSALAAPKDYGLRNGSPVTPTANEDEEPMAVPTFNFGKK